MFRKHDDNRQLRNTLEKLKTPQQIEQPECSTCAVDVTICQKAAVSRNRVCMGLACGVICCNVCSKTVDTCKGFCFYLNKPEVLQWRDQRRG